MGEIVHTSKIKIVVREKGPTRRAMINVTISGTPYVIV
jgi:hypothetical protein